MKTSQPWVEKADPSRPSQLDVLGASSGDILAVMMELKVGPIPVVLQKQVKYWSVIPCLLPSIDQSGGILGEPQTYSHSQRMQGIHKPTVEDIELNSYHYCAVYSKRLRRMMLFVKKANQLLPTMYAKTPITSKIVDEPNRDQLHTKILQYHEVNS